MARKQKKALGAPAPVLKRELTTLERQVVRYERDHVDLDHAQYFRWQRGSEAQVGTIAEDGAPKIQRAYDGVAQLYAAGRIGDAEVDAASRWARDYERHQRSPYVHPATAGIRGGGGSGPELVLCAGIDASWRREEAAIAIGQEGVQLLLAFVLHGRSLRAVARDAGKSGGRACVELSAKLVRTLYALSDHYAYADRHGYRGILDPARRPPERTRELTAAERMPA